ncbi:transgelin [Anaeramoeba flamelloides]|uniref:Transgelin n=1 Tax=Anaeramoeba flamelloides TaxID=1746091 RepID=A0ABQ8YMV6_9EUKA|nr:transgelin [Anaeramoeba flamelloides]
MSFFDEETSLQKVQTSIKQPRIHLFHGSSNFNSLVESSSDVSQTFLNQLSSENDTSSENEKNNKKEKNYTKKKKKQSEDLNTSMDFKDLIQYSPSDSEQEYTTIKKTKSLNFDEKKESFSNNEISESEKENQNENEKKNETEKEEENENEKEKEKEKEKEEEEEEKEEENENEKEKNYKGLKKKESDDINTSMEFTDLIQNSPSDSEQEYTTIKKIKSLNFDEKKEFFSNNESSQKVQILTFKSNSRKKVNILNTGIHITVHFNTDPQQLNYPFTDISISLLNGKKFRLEFFVFSFSENHYSKRPY